VSSISRITQDLVGTRFTRLVVVAFAGLRQRSDGRNRTYWECRCDCGNIVTVPRDRLVGKGTQSCGCLAREVSLAKIRAHDNFKPLHHVASRYIYHNYRASAKQRGYAFTITLSDFAQTIQTECFYCGASPAKELILRKRVYLYNGLDRRDNRLGYSFDNLVPCCWPCNLSKGRRSEEEFLVAREKGLYL
jgi:hypothetical protein